VSTVVLDACVAAKWWLPAPQENLRREALNLLERYADGEIRFIVPDLFWLELGNILWKAMRQRRCPRSLADTAITEARERKFPTVSSGELLTDAFAIAAAFDRAVYDCVYVALAVAFNGELVTADERLANALATYFPVKWLGAI
jgi:predicted nucleic acid-binding protein